MPGDQDDPAPPSVAFAAKYPRAGPALLICSGVLSMGAVAWLMAIDLAPSVQGIAFLCAVFLSPVLIYVGTARLVRGKRSGWTALAIDSAGIHFGAQPGAEPRSFCWDEVSALIMFSRRTEIIKGAIRCVGVRLHPCSRESPERFLAEAARRRERTDLGSREREQLNSLMADLADLDPELAVSFHAEARGWGYTRARLRTAMRVHAPGVPVFEFPSDAYFDLVGWRHGRERLRQIIEDAELGAW